MAITTASLWKAYKATAATTWDGQLATIVPAAIAAIERYTNRVFDQATFTEYHDGDLSGMLVARNAPITSITSIKIVRWTAGVAVVESTYGTSDYIFEGSSGKIRLADSRYGRLTFDEYHAMQPVEWADSPYFPKGFQNIQLVYVGGYAAIPADLTLAANQWIDVLLSQALVGIGASVFEMERLGLYQYKHFNDADRGSMFRRLFGQFRRLTLGGGA